MVYLPAKSHEESKDCKLDFENYILETGSERKSRHNPLNISSHQSDPETLKGNDLQVHKQVETGVILLLHILLVES